LLFDNAELANSRITGTIIKMFAGNYLEWRISEDGPQKKKLFSKQENKEFGSYP